MNTVITSSNSPRSFFAGGAALIDEETARRKILAQTTASPHPIGPGYRVRGAHE